MDYYDDDGFESAADELLRRRREGQLFGPSETQYIQNRGHIWVDGRGKEVPVREMETSHILNCIQLLSDRSDRLVEVLEKYNRKNNAVANIQLDMWRNTIEAFFNELDYRAKRLR